MAEQILTPTGKVRKPHSSPAVRADAIRRYNAGEDVEIVAASFNITSRTLFEWVGRFCQKPVRRKVMLSEGSQHDLATRYSAGERDLHLAASFGVARATARTCAVRLGYGPRARIRRLALDEGAFSVITPESAYWAGFMMADGCVTARCTVKLSLAAEDAGHIEKFRSFLKSGHKINVCGRGTWKGYARQDLHTLAVSSDQLAADLAALGIVRRKTQKEEAVPALAMNRDFWRGVVDGDGTIHTSPARPGRGGPTAAVGLCNGGPRLLEQFVEFAKTIAPVTGTISCGKEGAYSITVGAKAHVKAILHALYDEAWVSLDRKAHKAHDILQRD